MLIEVLIAIIAGIFAGSITGLIPGIHINLVASLVMANITYFVGLPIIALACFISALSITHIFMDFIPSIFLGAPDDDTILAVLPGHKLLKSGEGIKAIKLMLQGAASAFVVFIICIPIYILFLPSIQNFISNAIPYMLIWVSVFIIFRDRNPFISLAVFSLSGILGFISFNTPVHEPLLPLLTGLFGTSGIITSLSGSKNIPNQKELPKTNLMPKSKYIFSIIPASIFGAICSFLPGIGSSHIAVLSSEVVKQNRKQFLFLTGLSSSLAMLLSFVAAYSIGKTRTGSAAFIKEVLVNISPLALILIIASSIISAFVAYYLCLKISKKYSVIIPKMNYTYLGIFVISILLILNLILTNYIGIVILSTSTALGIWAIKSGSKRINLMGSLILPTILYYMT